MNLSNSASLALALALAPFGGLAAEETNTPATPPAAPVADAPATPQPTPAATLVTDPGARFSSPVKEIVKMRAAGVPDEVMKSYIENSTSTFNLSSDNIIQLQSLGVSGPVTAGMLTHDKALRDVAANYAYAAAPPPPPQAQPVPAYQYYAPQPAYVEPQSSGVQVVYIPNHDYNPYGVWNYGDPYGYYWLPNTWVGYPWGLGFSSGRWWHHPVHGAVWSPGGRIHGGRGGFSGHIHSGGAPVGGHHSIGGGGFHR